MQEAGTALEERTGQVVCGGQEGVGEVLVGGESNVASLRPMHLRHLRVARTSIWVRYFAKRILSLGNSHCAM